MTRKVIDQAEMQEMFAYCQTTGRLFWKANRGRVKAGDVAGYLRPNGYRYVGLDGVSYREHRVIWTIANGPIPAGKEINHKDENKTHNKLENLEIVTPAQNLNHGTRNARAAAAKRGQKQTPQHNARIAAAMRGKKQSAQHIARAAAATCRPIFCHQTSTTYRSGKHAAEELGVRAGSISDVLHGKREHAGGFSFSFVQTTNISEGALPWAM